MSHSVSEDSALTVQDPTDVGMSGSVTGRGPVTGYDPPVQSYNGDYIPSLSSQAGYPQGKVGCVFSIVIWPEFHMWQ